MTGVSFPKVYLAIDNCFASKRFTEPEDWVRIIKSLGINFIEASADSECDPLYQGEDYLKRWVDIVRKATLQNDMKVCNLYSGHGTYSTLGLAHSDPSVRERMLEKWLKPMADVAASLGAGLGFFCHAFSDRVLQDPELYKEYSDILIKNLSELTRYAHSVGCEYAGVEQMYSPHQIPWTIEGAKEIIRKVSNTAQEPFFVTIDTGHQSGQFGFLKPGREKILDACNKIREYGTVNHLWLGPETCYRMLENCRSFSPGRIQSVVNEMSREMDKFPYLFASSRDTSTYTWLEDLAVYSPIIHLQQTNGNVSAHWPFTRSNNEKGIIEGIKLLKAVKYSFECQEDIKIQKVDKIFLTLEVFASTGSINYDTINDLRESVRYWRQFIPEDGIPLDELI